MIVTGDVVGVPPGKEGGEGELGEHDQFTATLGAVTQHLEQALDDGLSGFVFGDRTELGGPDHEGPPGRLLDVGGHAVVSVWLVG